jgi:diguanylate cyclase (GGDEF)-like protein/PAS domain S-box-containing protein
MTERISLYRRVLDNLYDGVYFVDETRHITYWNKGAERITGYPKEAVIGRRCADDLLMHVDESGEVLCQNGCSLQSTLEDGKTREAQLYLHHCSGHRIPVMLRVMPIKDKNGAIVGAVETFSDTSYTVATLRRLREIDSAALQDALTGIGNRRFIEIKLQSVLIEEQRQNISAGVLFMDIDRFKRVNDTFGHAVGDRVLKMVANTLRQNLRATDDLGRWGGEEFMAIVRHVDKELLLVVAEKLRRLVSRSHLTVGDQRVHVTISIGATLITLDDTPGDVLRRADQLLYQSKQNGRNRVSFEIKPTAIPVTA